MHEIGYAHSTMTIGNFPGKIKTLTAVRGTLMGRYVDSVLLKGETPIYAARKCLRSYGLRFVIGGLLVVFSAPWLIAVVVAPPDVAEMTGPVVGIFGICLLVGLAVIVWPFVIRRTTELVITNNRVIAKYGVLTTSTLEIRFDKIESVRVRQGLLGRIFGYGDIEIRGTGSTFDPITSIAYPKVFKANLDRAMHPEPVAAAA